MTSQAEKSSGAGRAVEIPVAAVRLAGELTIPDGAVGIVLFAHGSGSSRHSPRNHFVARFLCDAGIGTLLFDLLNLDEEAVDARTAELRFDIGLLASRLGEATRWLRRQADAGDLPFGYFGASTGGAAALVAAAVLGDEVKAVVSRGGRPDLAGDALAAVRAATLLLVGGWDEPVIRMNQEAYAKLFCTKALTIVPGATHLFEEPGTLEAVAQHAATWFRRHLSRQA
ncbi:dienelactone hydrolase family protein [Aromatoleum buckelii]|uniref:Alpha/beta hydrolase n=1 Tax=Aromatoleum buckelii TaxID=200254 RepID=A0ABX1N1B9_9RHOO|nr:dienelactone hydrolase family protein [Aromatoleum buckelii]MCK0510140.1 dienelactone hydrolase family protein [Aromatoleum buckelii]